MTGFVSPCLSLHLRPFNTHKVSLRVNDMRKMGGALLHLAEALGNLQCNVSLLGRFLGLLCQFWWGNYERCESVRQHINLWLVILLYTLPQTLSIMKIWYIKSIHIFLCSMLQRISSRNLLTSLPSMSCAGLPTYQQVLKNDFSAVDDTDFHALLEVEY